MLAQLVVEFLGNSTYSEPPSLYQEPYVGRARFEFLLPLLIAAGVAVSEVLVSVSAWSAWAVPELVGKLVRPAPLMWVVGVNDGASG